MLLCDRRAILLLSLALPACGFSPVHGPDGAGNKLLGRVRIDAPADRDSFILVERLEERLGRGGAPEYGLGLALVVKQERMAIDASNITTRFNVIGRATYALRSLDSGKVLLSGSADSFTGYSATGSTADTRAAERDAHERLMTILADRIVTLLLARAEAELQ